MVSHKLTATLRVRVDAQLASEVKRVVADVRTRAKFADYTQSEALRYLLKLGLAAYADDYEIDARGHLVRVSED